MNVLSVNLGFILFFSLFIWIFLVNDLYLKVFFLKTNAKKRRNERVENYEKEIFDNVLGGYSIPKYIKDSILKSQDQYQLLSLYMASRSLNNMGMFNKITKNNFSSISENCVSFIMDGVHKYFLNAVLFIRVIALFFLAYYTSVFIENFLISNKPMILDSGKSIFYLAVILIVLMPYNVFYKGKFFNKIFGISVFYSSVLLSLFLAVYIHNYTGDLFFNKFIILFFLIYIMFCIGSYSYISYKKLEYLVSFFNLLKDNQVQQESLT